MKLSIFGGSRGTGLQVIEGAISSGHEITALVRRPETLKERFSGIHVVLGDVFNLEDVKRTVKGSEAIISTLGFVG